MLEISRNEIKSRMGFDNPWWQEGITVERRFREMPRRSYFEPFFRLATDRTVNRAVVLMGPRRVGKTVMVFQAIQKLIETGIPGTSILYLSLETPIYTGLSLEQILHLFQEHNSHQRDDYLLIWFDEIQYLKNWEVHLKSLVDSYPNYKFIATGSAAAALRLKSQESGAGRFSDFLLPPLTFAEYINFIGLDDEFEIDQDQHYRAKDIERVNIEFVNYLNYGGYPEAVFSETVQADSSRYIRSDIIDKVLLRDLPSLYGIGDIQELNRLFNTIAYNTGNEVTLENLSKNLGVAKNTLKRYIEYLEAAFLIQRVHRIDENAQRFKRATSFKVYLTNPAMRSALFGYTAADSLAMGALTETAMFSQWLHSSDINPLHYARWKEGEVDMICLESFSQKPLWCLEVKWSDRVVANHDEINGLLKFLTIHGSQMRDEPTVTTKTIRHHFPVQGFPIKFVPSAELVYTIGKNNLGGMSIRYGAKDE
jgi:uncharacterized protein